MARNSQPDRWESLILAAALAVAGTWFLFNRFAPFMPTLDLSQAILHTASALLAGVAVSLVLAIVSTEPGNLQSSRKGCHE